MVRFLLWKCQVRISTNLTKNLVVFLIYYRKSGHICPLYVLFIIFKLSEVTRYSLNYYSIIKNLKHKLNIAIKLKAKYECCEIYMMSSNQFLYLESSLQHEVTGS